MQRDFPACFLHESPARTYLPWRRLNRRYTPGRCGRRLSSLELPLLHANIGGSIDPRRDAIDGLVRGHYPGLVAGKERRLGARREGRHTSYLPPHAAARGGRLAPRSVTNVYPDALVALKASRAVAVGGSVALDALVLLLFTLAVHWRLSQRVGARW